MGHMTQNIEWPPAISELPKQLVVEKGCFSCVLYFCIPLALKLLRLLRHVTSRPLSALRSELRARTATNIRNFLVSVLYVQLYIHMTTRREISGWAGGWLGSFQHCLYVSLTKSGSLYSIHLFTTLYSLLKCHEQLCIQNGVLDLMPRPFLVVFRYIP